MAKINVAIDLGTSYTTIYMENQGVVLKEPTLIAYSGKDSARKLICVGNDAAEMLGKTPQNTTIVRPVSEGYIVDGGAAAMMLAEFLKKITGELSPFARLNAILAVPTGLSVDERKIYGDICYQAGIDTLDMVDNIMLSAIAMDLPVDEATGSLIVNIGGGSTEIALLSLSSIITGCSVSIGGDMMDGAINDYIVGKYGLRIGKGVAKRIKEEIGSLYANDGASMEIKGVNSKTLVPATCTIYATDIYEALLPYYSKLADAVSDVVKTCPRTFAEDLTDKGVYVIGGGAKILGLERVFKKMLGLEIHVSPTADYSAAVGGGKLLSNKPLLRKILNA